METFTPFENAVIDFLLDGSDPVQAEIRAQLDCCKVTGREQSGVGFFTYLQVPEGTARIKERLNFDVGATVYRMAGIDNPADIVWLMIFVRDGLVDWIEGVALEGPWDVQSDYPGPFYPDQGEIHTDSDPHCRRNPKVVMRQSRRMQVDVSELERLLTQHGIESARAYARRAEAALGLSSIPIDLESVAIGESRIGGHPDLPPEFQWPTHQGESLRFLAQIDLSDAQLSLFPDAGWLYFFCQHDLSQSIKRPISASGKLVLFHEGPRDGLVRTGPPTQTDECASPEAHQLNMSVFPTLPSLCDTAYLGELFRRDRNNPVDSEFIRDYQSVAKQLRASEGTLEASFHQMLGCPDWLESCPRAALELAYKGFPMFDLSRLDSSGIDKWQFRAKEACWTLLLQLSTSELNHNNLSGLTAPGRLYFMIRRQDLLDRRFDKTWMILQCG